MGMGAELFDRHPDLLIGVADRILGWSLRDVCLQGPEERLTATHHAQPALYALAWALWTELADRVGYPPVAAAGHSLGEYTALSAAGVLSFEDGLELVAARAKAMKEAVEVEPSGMAVALGVADDRAEEVASARRSAGGRLWVANLNAPGQVVLAGASEDIDWLVADGRRMGLRRVTKLKVAGAFHSPLMDPAVPTLRTALRAVRMGDPAFPVWSNVTGSPIAPGEERRLLARQLVAPVRFADSLRSMAASGVGTFVHVGPGGVTAGMARRSVRGSDVLTVSSIQQAESAGDSLAV